MDETADYTQSEVEIFKATAQLLLEHARDVGMHVFTLKDTSPTTFIAGLVDAVVAVDDTPAISLPLSRQLRQAAYLLCTRKEYVGALRAASLSLHCTEFTPAARRNTIGNSLGIAQLAIQSAEATEDVAVARQILLTLNDTVNQTQAVTQRDVREEFLLDAMLLCQASLEKFTANFTQVDLRKTLNIVQQAKNDLSIWAEQAMQELPERSSKVPLHILRMFWAAEPPPNKYGHH